MEYTNASRVLPPELIEAIQNYVDGGLIYIPRRAENRLGWGAGNGSREALRSRNRTICQAYRDGRAVPELAEIYHLSEDSVRKIIFPGTRR